MSELTAVVRQQSQQALASLAAGEVLEAGTFLVDALVQLADAVERLQRRLERQEPGA